MKEKKWNNSVVLFVVLAGTIFFLIVGYYASGAFAKYMGYESRNNQYTPIIILLSLVIYEMICFLYLALSRARDKRAEDAINNISEKSEIDEAEAPKQTNDIETDLSFTKGREKLVRELYFDYSMEQITELVRIADYIPDVTASTIRKMFQPALSAAEIRQYIDMYYE